MDDNDQSKIAAFLANEQTFLAWLRTGVEVMAFGFVAIKFSLFASQIMGIILVGAGALMTALAYFRYRSTVKQLRQDRYNYDTFLLTAVTVAIFIISVILLVCLVDAYLKTSNSNESTNKKEKMDQLPD